MQQLQGSGKATKIFSTPKYPGPEKLHDYVPFSLGAPESLKEIDREELEEDIEKVPLSFFFFFSK